MCFESAEMYGKAREAEEARRRKLADDLKRRDQHCAPAKPHTWLWRVIQPALGVLLVVFSLAAEGQVLAGERLSGPALVGAVTIRQVANTTDATLTFVGDCKGITAPFSTTLSPFTVADTTAASLEGQRLLGKGPDDCLSQQGGENLIVTTVVASQFVKTGDDLLANRVVILFVVPQ